MDHICNMCGKQFDILDKQENFGFNYYVGYGSKHDLEYIEAHFCCQCFDKILDQLIPQLKVPLLVEEYELESDTDLKNVSMFDGAEIV